MEIFIVSCRPMASFKSIRALPRAAQTRLAPTPSGFLHLGNVLSFAITAYLARRTGARILLRIDDLDRERVQPEYLDDIFETLKFLDIPWNTGPKTTTDFREKWSQYTRMNRYHAALQKLEREKQVFACECSRAQIAAAAPDGSYPGTCLHKKIDLHQPNVQWRLKTRPGRIISVNRLAAPPLKSTLPALMHHFVVRKKDGAPAYQLASLVDDLEMGNDLVIRGVDLWPSTWAQLYLADILQEKAFSATAFVHHPLLLQRNGNKLSKSAGATSIQYLRKQGMKKEEIFGEVARLLGSTPCCSNWKDLGRLMEKNFAP